MREITSSSIFQSFLAQNAASQTHAERASKLIPTGMSRSLLKHAPFPFYVAKAQGIESLDIDGNRRIDCQNNYTTMIHGHGHPSIMAAVRQQLESGTSYSAPAVQEYRLAEHLCERIASVDQVVFNNSGTEAVMAALRIARAYTGRNKIAKFEGGYHGWSDFMMVGGHDIPAPEDPVRLSTPVADLNGLPQAATEDVVLLRFNDPQSVVDAVAQYGDELAAIIFEPILGAGGVISATAEFLETLRSETAKAGIVLICDEVISLRQAVGGAQGYFGIDPDLTTMAKNIGGGFPIGAVGGKREVMKVLDEPAKGGSVANLGTFSANPISTGAGLVCMELLDEAAIAHVNAMGDMARDGLANCITRHGAPAQVTGTGSLLQVHWTEAELTDGRGPASADPELNLLTFLGLCNRGVQVSMRGIAALSTPMVAGDIEKIVNAFDDTVAELKREHWF